jgi:hypothetical protein
VTDPLDLQGSSPLLGLEGEGSAHEDNWPPWCTNGNACETAWPQIRLCDVYSLAV